MKLSQSEISALKELLTKAENRSSEILVQLYTKLSMDETVDLYVDGAADRHSKTAGIGGVFYQQGNEILTFSEFYGDATNNEAEYYALIKGLGLAVDMNISQLKIFSDSQLIVKQINGEFNVKHENMIPLHTTAQSLLAKFDSWIIDHIPRERNSVADKLSKAGMLKGRNR